MLFTYVFKTVTVLSVAHGQIGCGSITWPRTQTSFRTVLLSGGGKRENRAGDGSAKRGLLAVSVPFFPLKTSETK